MSRVFWIHRLVASLRGSAAAPLPLLGAGAAVVRVGLPPGYRAALSLSARSARWRGTDDLPPPKSFALLNRRQAEIQTTRSTEHASIGPRSQLTNPTTVA